MIFHVSDRSEWERAVPTGAYTGSTRGLDLSEVGFIHLSSDAQYPTVLELFYADATDLVLLHVDESKLSAELRWEDVPGADAPFPHLYGPLNVDAVVDVTPIPDPPQRFT